MAADAAAQARRGQLDCGQLLLGAKQAAFVASLHQLARQCGGGGEADRHALLAGRQPEAEGDMGLAGATGPEGVMSKTCLRHDDVLTPQGPFAAGKFQHLRSPALSNRWRLQAHC